MNPDDNTPQKPVTPPTGGMEEPTRPTPWVPSESDAAESNAAGIGTNATGNGGMDDAGMSNDTFGVSDSTAAESGQGMPQPPQPPTFDTAGESPMPDGLTPPPMPGPVPGPAEPPLPPQPPLPPAPGQPGMPGGPQFGAPVQPGMPDGNTPLVPMPDGPQTQPAHATSPALMMGLLAVGVLIIIGFIIFLFLKK